MSNDPSPCVLCGQLALRPIVAEEKIFCCPGCRVVYEVLAVRSKTAQAKETPLFQEAVRSGLISNPQLLANLQEEERSAEEKVRFYFQIPDLWCPSCAQLITWILLQKTGILSCRIDYATDFAVIDYNPRNISQEGILNLIQHLGYHPTTLEEEASVSLQRRLAVRLGLSAFCTLNVMMLSYPIYSSLISGTKEEGLFSWLSFIMTLPVVTYCAWPFFRRFFGALRQKAWSVESLVVIAVCTGMALSIDSMLRGVQYVYFDTVTAIVTFVLWGKWLQSRAKISLKKTLYALGCVLPKRARKITSEKGAHFVPIKEVHKGDQVVVYCGEKIVVDGRIAEGLGSVDESIITGEAVPIPKVCGDKVTAGSLLIAGTLVVDVIQPPERSFIHEMVALVQQDMPHKRMQPHSLDQLLQYFIPAILFIAFVAFLVLGSTVSWYEGMTRAIALLVAACPCAVGIAVPLAEALTLSRLSEEGVLVRNRAILPLLAKVSHWVFDKTGTLTDGQLKIEHVLIWQQGAWEKEAQWQHILSLDQMALLQSCTAVSIHPISLAIQRTLPSEGVFNILSVREHAGQGVEIPDVAAIGSRAFVTSLGYSCPEPHELASACTFFTTKDLTLCFVFTDSIRPETKETLEALGPERCHLLSGDHARSVKRVAHALGIAARSEQSPVQKHAFIHNEQQKGVVVMVGDGMNDAPALAAADVGISLLEATDLSLQVSDVILTRSNLSTLPMLERHAKKMARIIRQNIFWAFFYNILALLCALIGWTTPLIAAAAMTLSSLLVIINAQRMNRL